MLSSETTRRSDQVPRGELSKQVHTLERLNEHNSVLLAGTGNILTHLLDNTHSLATSNSGESHSSGISSIDLLVSIPISSPYSVHIEGSDRGSNHSDLDVFVSDVTNGGLLHSRSLQTRTPFPTSPR